MISDEVLHAELAVTPVMPPCGYCREGHHSACNRHVIFDDPVTGESLEDICGCYINTHPRPDGTRA